MKKKWMFRFWIIFDFWNTLFCYLWLKCFWMLGYTSFLFWKLEIPNCGFGYTPKVICNCVVSQKNCLGKKGLIFLHIKAVILCSLILGWTSFISCIERNFAILVKGDLLQQKKSTNGKIYWTNSKDIGGFNWQKWQL